MSKETLKGTSKIFADSMTVAYERWDLKENEYKEILEAAQNEIQFWKDNFDSEIRSNLRRQEILMEKNLKLKAKIKILTSKPLTHKAPSL